MSITTGIGMDITSHLDGSYEAWMAPARQVAMRQPAASSSSRADELHELFEEWLGTDPEGMSEGPAYTQADMGLAYAAGYAAAGYAAASGEAGS